VKSGRDPRPDREALRHDGVFDPGSEPHQERELAARGHDARDSEVRRRASRSWPRRGEASGAKTITGKPSRRRRPRNETVSHVVSSGETLSDIADRYDVAMTDLVAWNSIADADAIHPGQKLVVTHDSRAGEGLALVELHGAPRRHACSRSPRSRAAPSTISEAGTA
jgi:nucleoid-associated protein YgaU